MSSAAKPQPRRLCYEFLKAPDWDYAKVSTLAEEVRFAAILSSPMARVGRLTRRNSRRYAYIMETSDLITIDPEILGGTPVFKGTRVPIKTLLEYLEDNYALNEFLECFPSVTREMAQRVLERSESALFAAAAAGKFFSTNAPPGRFIGSCQISFAP